MAEQVSTLRNYINGEWVESKGNMLDVKNPANDKTIARVPLSTRLETRAAVEAAHNAFPGWRDTPLNRRIELLSQFRDLLKSEKESIARLITSENGKVLADARGEMGRGLENETFGLNIDLMSGRHLYGIATGNIESYSLPTPLGPFCGILPGNFPAMIFFWSMEYAILAGNTFIAKPSEQTPLTLSRIFELINEIDFPAGVINMVHGDKYTSEWLVAHEDMQGVISVTSTPAMKAIAHQAGLNNKRFICQGGAKNFVVVDPSFDLERDVPKILESVFGNSGQRCLAGSNVVLVGDKRFYNKVLEALVEAARKWIVGEGTREGVKMGPVISRDAQERIFDYIAAGEEAGAELVLDGRVIKVEGDPNGYWVGPTIFSGVTPDMAIACEEIFGPVMTVLHAHKLEDAIDMIKASPYGNAAVIFARNGSVTARFKRPDVQIGNLGINIALPAPIPPFSFGGMKDSFRGVLHSQGTDMVQFFTNYKIVIEHWPDDCDNSDN